MILIMDKSIPRGYGNTDHYHMVYYVVLVYYQCQIPTTKIQPLQILCIYTSNREECEVALVSDMVFTSSSSSSLNLN